MSEFEVKEYVSSDGTNYFEKWFDTLDAAAKVTAARLRVEAGNTSNINWFRGIGEYKIDWGKGYRIYLAKVGERFILLLGGGTKKRQQKDIEQAVKLHKEYKKRKKDGDRTG